MVDETINNPQSQLLLDLTSTLEDQNKTDKETNAVLSSFGDVFKKFIASQSVNALEEEEKRREQGEDLGNTISKLEFKGLGDELKDSGGIFKGFVGGLSLIVAGFFGFLQAAFEDLFSFTSSTRRLFLMTFQLKDPNKGLGFVRFQLMLLFEKIGNVVRSIFSLKTFEPLRNLFTNIGSLTKGLLGEKSFSKVSKFFQGVSKFFGIFGRIGFAIGQTLGRLFKPITIAIAFFRGLDAMRDTFGSLTEEGVNPILAGMGALLDGLFVGIKEFVAMFVGGLLDTLKFFTVDLLARLFIPDEKIKNDILNFSFADGFRFIFDKIKEIVFGFFGSISELMDNFNITKLDFISPFSMIKKLVSSFMENFGDSISDFFTNSIEFISDRIHNAFRNITELARRAVDKIKGTLDYLLKLPMAFFNGITAAANIFGAGTVSDRFNKAFDSTISGSDIETVLSKPSGESEKEKTIREATQANKAGSNIQIIDNSVKDQSQTSNNNSNTGILGGVKDFFFGKDNDKQEVAK